MASPESTLETNRLILKPLSHADLRTFHATNTEDFVKIYLWDNEDVPEQVSRDLLEAMERTFKTKGWGLWQVLSKADGQYLGYAGLWTFFDEPQPQLLYALHEEFTGHGYATEAAGAVVDYAFEQLGFDYVIASMDAPNTSSVEVCKRLGFLWQEERTIDGKPTVFFRLDRPSAPLPARK